MLDAAFPALPSYGCLGDVAGAVYGARGGLVPVENMESSPYGGGYWGLDIRWRALDHERSWVF